jgi:hypothetical protein
LWRDDPRLVSTLLIGALGGGPERRLAALAALDARNDGIGLGALGTSRPLAPATGAALNAIAGFVRDAVAARLDDGVPAVRAGALRVLAKLGDARLTAGRVAAAAAGGPEERAAAVAIARRWAGDAPRDARALADALATALASHGGPAEPADGWEARLGLVEALSATGEPGLPALARARDDANPIVRAAALEGGGAPPRAPRP